MCGSKHGKRVRDSFGVDLRTWIRTEHATPRERFEQQVAARVPSERWADAAGGASTITWLRFHTAWHEDLAVNVAVRGGDPVLSRWRDRLGLGGRELHDGLGEAEQPAVTNGLDPEQLRAYADEVSEATAAWLADVDLRALDTVPDATTRMEGAGVTEEAVPWLHAMWEGKAVAWLVQWEAIGHPLNHVGEMVAIRNRLGLSPF
jgi:hypothetical protein